MNEMFTVIPTRYGENIDELLNYPGIRSFLFHGSNCKKKG